MSSPGPGNSCSIQDTISDEHHQLSLECEKLWQRVKNVQVELENLPTEDKTSLVAEVSVNQAESEEHVYRLLQEYEKRLRAELEFLQGCNVDDITSTNTECQYIILLQEKMKQKEHLKETLSYVKARYSSLVESLEQDEDMNVMLKRLQDTLKTKSSVENPQHSGCLNSKDHNLPDRFADMKTIINKQKQTNKQFQSKLIDLLSNFPSPPTSSSKDSRRKIYKNALDSSRDFNEGEFMSLSSIIGKLMEQTLNSPGQPYIDIGDNMWPQHIEFLLRSQVVIKDPENSTRIKFVPFQL